MIPTGRSNKCLLMVDGYTYSQANYSPRWICSSYRRNKCPARLRYQNHKVDLYESHNHPPPKYMYENGEFIKVAN